MVDSHEVVACEAARATLLALAAFRLAIESTETAWLFCQESEFYPLMPQRRSLLRVRSPSNVPLKQKGACCS
jgi:hypothetical protein